MGGGRYGAVIGAIRWLLFSPLAGSVTAGVAAQMRLQVGHRESNCACGWRLYDSDRYL